ncbi:hypothetical protein ABZX40_26775 [Streptomyces sp. NPDC004610]|uniref:hypothetical protein n=1 Tax=unclassified Streptomyces TaxID=2593676 RepID=UPI0033BC3C8F
MKLKRALAGLGLTGAVVAGTLAMTATPASAAYNRYVGTYANMYECQSAANWYNQYPLDGHYFYCSARPDGAGNLWEYIP